LTWTITPDDNDTIHVRAIINVSTQQHELRSLIASLEKRLTKENTDATGSADVRIPGAGSFTPAEKTPAEADPQAEGS
jgi:hypothetical protein